MFYDKVADYCYENRISVRKFEIMCGFSNGTVGGWRTADPSIKSLKVIVEKTEIPYEEWLKED